MFMSGCTEHAYVQYLYPAKEANVISNLPGSGNVLWHGNPTLPEIALTFDDGPNSKNTPKVLDILKAYNVKATFFVLGKFIEKNKDILKREAKEGHSIGNHTYTHADGKITDTAKIERELGKTSDLILKYSGIRPKLFRPPFGFENWRFFNEAERLNNDIVLWTTDIGDWDHKKTESAILSGISRNTRNGSIILLHDGGSSREAVLNALPKIITSLKKKGYRFVTIDEMISHL